METKIIQPTIRGLQKANIKYTGFIFFGLINVDGEPYVIEYNVRLGDPETQVILPRIDTDLLELFINIENDSLFQNLPLKISQLSAATVILSSEVILNNILKAI